MKALRVSGLNILNTFVLAIIGIFFFVVLVFLVFTKPFIEEAGVLDPGAFPADKPPCETLYGCFGSMMTAGIYGTVLVGARPS